ncbi:MAG: [acyl-carrier-protein] S-malonyltransferase [Chloroflexi bacterium]|nr:[acyl-carrier-protein] S-malonyltransferase [Chloroflexota bacterium]
MRFALIFPGQGSQVPGMGQDLVRTSPAAREVFESADDILGFSLSALCFNGPSDILTETINAQPALLATSMAILEALREAVNAGSASAHLSPAYVAGHSMGEVTAVVASGALTVPNGLRLIRARGEAMQFAGEQNPGAMAAVLGLEAEVLDQACRRASQEIGRPVQLANDNAPGQIVVSGDKDALVRVSEMARAAGARRVIPLAVSIAAHSPLMQPAIAHFSQSVASTFFALAEIPLIANITARPMIDPDELKTELIQQLTYPVRWVESVRYMVSQGVDTFVEVGPGNVLTGLVKRIAPEVHTLSIGDAAGIEAFIQLQEQP